MQKIKFIAVTAAIECPNHQFKSCIDLLLLCNVHLHQQQILRRLIFKVLGSLPVHLQASSVDFEAESI